MAAMYRVFPILLIALHRGATLRKLARRRPAPGYQYAVVSMEHSIATAPPVPSLDATVGLPFGKYRPGVHGQAVDGAIRSHDDRALSCSHRPAGGDQRRLN